ncbi:MAG: phosphoadenylyl-sulfate reductase [Rhodospirillaceae bacterium]|nr:phosphoadenylyl-sulfate reductase [Rhodospirillaceae bacterium]
MSGVLHRRLALLRWQYGALPADSLVAALSRQEFPGRIALVSSFGAESAVLLHMIAAVDRGLDVVFLDTGKLFGETLRYRDRLIDRLGLTNVRTITPDPAALAARDSDGTLWSKNPDACCAMRKVETLARALAPYDAWFNGRKAFQGGARAGLDTIEIADGRFKINPLAGWTRTDIDRYFADHDLPPHPLVPDGYLSIGCMPCTTRVTPGEDQRAGRWRGTPKTECGIHLPSLKPAA